MIDKGQEKSISDSSTYFSKEELDYLMIHAKPLPWPDPKLKPKIFPIKLPKNLSEKFPSYLLKNSNSKD